MKPSAPEVLRRGVLVRIAASRDHDDLADVLALAFLDLRFVDGHVERWIGPGSIGELSTKPDAMAALQLWARERAGDFAFDIMCEVARDYDVPNPRIVDALPCGEVVIEWNCQPVWRAHEA